MQTIVGRSKAKMIHPPPAGYLFPAEQEPSVVGVLEGFYEMLGCGICRNRFCRWLSLQDNCCVWFAPCIQLLVPAPGWAASPVYTLRPFFSQHPHDHLNSPEIVGPLPQGAGQYLPYTAISVYIEDQRYFPCYTCSTVSKTERISGLVVYLAESSLSVRLPPRKRRKYREATNRNKFCGVVY